MSDDCVLPSPPSVKAFPLPHPSLTSTPSYFTLSLAAAGQALGEGRRENGATLLKRRLLERAGWRVVSVRHWEWEAATRAGGPEGQRAYLEGLLRSPGLPPGPPGMLGPSPPPLRPPPGTVPRFLVSESTLPRISFIGDTLGGEGREGACASQRVPP